MQFEIEWVCLNDCVDLVKSKTEKIDIHNNNNDNNSNNNNNNNNSNK